MAMQKTTIIEIRSKPKSPYFQYSCSRFSTSESAIKEFERLHGYIPKVLYFYNSISPNFRAWIVKKDENEHNKMEK